MERESSNSNYRMNIGGASVILILLVFSMTIFAILSIRASYHELTLAKNSRTHLSDYYTADSKAEEVKTLVYEDLAYGANANEIMRHINRLIHEEDSIITDANILYANDDSSLFIIDYSITKNENSYLYVKLEVDGSKLSVLEWSMKTNELTGYGGEGFDIWESDWFE